MVARTRRRAGGRRAFVKVGEQRIEGLEEFDKVLRSLPKTIARRELAASARAGAAVLRDRIRNYAPVGDEPAHPKYGRLRKNIRVRIQRRASNDTTALAIVHTHRAFWGRFLEFGSVHQSARPWITPAFEASKGAALKAAFDRLSLGIERSATELAGKFGSLRASTKRAISR